MKDFQQLRLSHVLITTMVVSCFGFRRGSQCTASIICTKARVDSIAASSEKASSWFLPLLAATRHQAMNVLAPLSGISLPTLDYLISVMDSRQSP